MFYCKTKGKQWASSLFSLFKNLGPLILCHLYPEFKEAGWSANYWSNLLKNLKNEMFGQNLFIDEKNPNISSFDLNFFSYLYYTKKILLNWILSELIWAMLAYLLLDLPDYVLYFRFKDHPILNERYLLLNLLGKGGFSEVHKVSTELLFQTSWKSACSGSRICKAQAPDMKNISFHCKIISCSKMTTRC